MLVLTREANERINLYRDGSLLGTVIMAGVRGNRARIGFEFPSDIAIVRSEVDDGRGGKIVGNGNHERHGNHE